MKERVFYRIHLDQRRMIAIALVSILALTGSYLAGKHQAGPTERPLDTLMEATGPQSESRPDPLDRTDAETESDSRGASVYEKPLSYAARPEAARLTSNDDESNQTHALPFQSKVSPTEKPASRPVKKNPKTRQKTKGLAAKSPPKADTRQRKSDTASRVTALQTAPQKNAGKPNSQSLANVGQTRSEAVNARADSTDRPDAKDDNPARKRDAATSQTTKTKTPRYYLQTGSFHSREAAARMSADLQKQGFPARLERSASQWVVRVGQPSNTKELWPLWNRLKAQKYPVLKVSADK
ncbi:MAG: SPOR domain-containing protein [Leptospiraceae bacterium]|nr:SPOR domain-containing protein [Leptospiraceae bacterium]